MAVKSVTHELSGASPRGGTSRPRRKGRRPPPTPRPETLARRLAALGGRRIGPHLPLWPGLLRGAERARVIGAAAVQVFADNPTAWRRKPEPPADIDRFRERLAVLDVDPVAVHASYLINLCGRDELFWRQSVEALAAELRMGARYGAFAVNVHIGSHRGLGREAGIDRLAAGLVEVQAAGGDGVPALALENSAGTGDGIGSALEDLADIQEAAGRAGADLSRVGFCLDTAHLWGAGYDVSGPAGVDDVLARCSSLLGPGRILMMHLNDSRAPLGSRRDRHEHIGAGAIGPRGMAALITHPALHDVPAYLETPGMDLGYDRVNMDRVRRLVAGEPLPTLPARAFTQRSARPRSGRGTGRDSGRASVAGAEGSTVGEDEQSEE